MWHTGSRAPHRAASAARGTHWGCRSTTAGSTSTAGVLPVAPTEETSTSNSSCRTSRPSCAKAATRSPPPSGASCPRWSAELRHPRRSPHAQHVERRPRHHRRHGPRRAAARLRVRRDHRSLRARWPRASWPPPTFPASGARSRQLRSAYQGDRDPSRHRGRHHARRHARLRRRACSKGSTSCWRRCTITAATTPTRLTERYLRAIRHPLVNVITHPANRSPAASTATTLDFDRLFAAAAETGTAMEIDGAPGHLDMDGVAGAPRGRRGRHAWSIDSDCHRIARRSAGRCASASAPRGAAGSSRGTCSTRASVDDVRAFVARKRARR